MTSVEETIREKTLWVRQDFGDMQNFIMEFTFSEQFNQTRADFSWFFMTFQKSEQDAGQKIIDQFGELFDKYCYYSTRIKIDRKDLFILQLRCMPCLPK